MLYPDSNNNASLEQLNAWEHVYAIAAALGAVDVTPLFYQGATAGTEFLSYNVNKLYFALEILFSQDSGVALSAPQHVDLHDEANAINLYLIDNIDSYFDTTAAAVKVTRSSTLLHYNLYFSRFVVQYFTHVKFNGFRLDITP